MKELKNDGEHTIHSNDDLQHSAHCVSVRPGPDDQMGWTYLESHQRWYGRGRYTGKGPCSILLTAFQCVQAQTIRWAGHTWKVTSGGMAGVDPGIPANVDFNPDGYLHLQIAKREGKWTAAELFTTDNMGYGTYQWV